MQCSLQPSLEVPLDHNYATGKPTTPHKYQISRCWYLVHDCTCKNCCYVEWHIGLSRFSHHTTLFVPRNICTHFSASPRPLLSISAGLGSAIAERLRDEYPLAHFLSISVAPFVSGESPLQHYNTLLSLRWLQNYSDAVVLFQNDRVLQQAEKCTSVAARECPRGTTHEFPKGPGVSGSRGGGVSLWDMNRHISGTLCSSLLPVEGLDKK